MRYSGFLPRLALITVLAASAVLGQTAPRKAMEGGVHRAQRAQSGTESPRELRRMQRPSRKVTLRALRAGEARPVTRKPGLVPIGVERALPPDVLSRGEWSVTPDGKRVWRLALESTGAEALRVHFTEFHLGYGKLWIFGTDEQGGEVSAGPYTGDGLLNDGDFWSDMLPGASVILAFEAGDDSSTLPFKLAAVSHRLPVVKKAETVTADDKTPVVRQAAAASCALDVACYPEYSEAASAVALMVFESEGSSYQCSGSLISSSAQPARPFFLTANHCIANEAEARSLIAYFNYQAASCNAAAPRLSGLPRVNGATFLAGGEMELGDYSLLQLRSFPDVDVKVLGWTAEEIAANEQVTGISHPRGDYKRISLGQRTRDVTIRFSDGARMPAGRGYQVSWFQGLTQGGSSGSPLLARINGKDFVVGTLSAGPDIDDDDDALACRARNTTGSYGRFSAAFAAFEPFLTSTGPASPSTTGPGSITASPLTLGPGQTMGRTVVRWQTAAVNRVQVRVDSPYGTPLTGIEAATGSATTGDWAAAGMVFYLQDATSGDSSGPDKTLATVQVQATSTTAARSGSITALPSVITLPAGQSAGRTTLEWRTTGVTRVQIRVNSPTGAIMTGLAGPSGRATTGNWVTNGMTFYLQDAGDGNSAGATRTLASVRVTVSR